jgi:hypothetical protein
MEPERRRDQTRADRVRGGKCSRDVPNLQQACDQPFRWARKIASVIFPVHRPGCHHMMLHEYRYCQATVHGRIDAPRQR